MSTNETVDALVREIAINAPASRVFEALSSPSERVKWWGSEGRFKATNMESDLRPGGKWSMSGIGVGDKPFTITGTYQEVEKPNLLVFTWLPDWHENAPTTTVRWDLEEKDGVTTVRLTHSGFATEKDKEYYQGWQLLLAMLKKHVVGN